MKEPLVSLRVDRGADKIQPNPYGYEHIHIWWFNYDGNGTALVTLDDSADLEVFHRNDLDYILIGDPESGGRWYHRVGSPS